MEDFSLLIQNEPVDLDDQPAFSFLGTDGQDYVIGHTPRVFEKEILTQLVNYSNEQIQNGSLPGFLDMIDRWIWMHVSCVPGQTHLTQEAVEALYFSSDRVYILKAILSRFMDASAANAGIVDILSNAARAVRENLPSQDPL